MAVAGAAKRYARAAFDLAKQHGALDEWQRDLDQLLESMEQASVAEFFESPAVDEAAKQRALASILPHEDQRYPRNLALLLLERGRLHQLPQLVDVFRSLVLEERGIAIADVTTAIELGASESDRVKEQIRQIINKEVELRPHVDPEIIGGIVVRIGDQLIDGSVQSQLQELRQRMVRA